MSEEMVCRKRRLSSFQIIILGFAGVILLGALLRREADMTLAPYAKPGEVMLQLSARGADERACEARMAPVLAEARASGRLCTAARKWYGPCPWRGAFSRGP